MKSVADDVLVHLIETYHGSVVGNALCELKKLREETAAMQRLLPSAETRQLVMTLCQDQGELTPGQRIDQVVEAYASRRRHEAPSHTEILTTAMEILDTVDIRLVEIRSRDEIVMGKYGYMEGKGKTGAEAYLHVLERRKPRKP